MLNLILGIFIGVFVSWVYYFISKYDEKTSDDEDLTT